MHSRSPLLLLFLSLLTLLFLPQILATPSISLQLTPLQTPQARRSLPSPDTIVKSRRAEPDHPLPTSISEVTDPELLSALTSHRSRFRKAGKGNGKIHGFNHGADALEITNAERMRLGLPLKPPAYRREMGVVGGAGGGGGGDGGDGIGEFLESTSDF